MTKKLQQVLKEAEKWPEEAQDELADAAREISQGLDGEYHASTQELAGIDRGLGDARRGNFASEEEVRAAFAKFRGA